jgi:dipeptidyl aminopeptidase/acylaminoacyl peptidase
MRPSWATPQVPLALTIATLLLGCGSTDGGGGSPTAPSPTPPTASAGRFDVVITGGSITQGGVLYRPDTSTGPKPGLVVLHGWQAAGTNGAAVVEGRARRYADEGYVALALSMRGWPPSGGSDDCGLRQPDDVIDALRWLSGQPGVDGQRLGIVGFSQGGQVALLAGSRGASVRAIVAYYPVTDVALWKQTTSFPDIPSYITQVCEPGGVTSRSPRQQAASLAAPVLLVHGDLDTRVPTDQSRLMSAAMDAAGRSATLLLVPGAAHGFSGDEEAFARPTVDRFLADRLR